MKITFPHMGYVYIPLKSLFENMGIEVVLPRANNSHIKALGYKHAPEHACMPFKLILGDILYALQKGADTVIMLGGSGPCRFGYFGNLLELIARDEGYQFRCIILEPSNLLYSLNLLRKLAGCSWSKMTSSILLGWKKLCTIDSMEKLYWKTVPYTSFRGEAERIFLESIGELERLCHLDDLDRLHGRYCHSMQQIRNIHSPRPRVGIVGDIYTLNEPFCNQNLDKMLVELGVEVERSIYPSEWVSANLFPWKKRRLYFQMLKGARQYIGNHVGGFALETVYNTLVYARMGFQGVIHIMPMTCMPEIVSRQILQKLSRDMNISMLSITVDEHEGTAGFRTRMEAFVEMLNKKNRGLY